MDLDVRVVRALHQTFDIFTDAIVKKLPFTLIDFHQVHGLNVAMRHEMPMKENDSKKHVLEQREELLEIKRSILLEKVLQVDLTFLHLHVADIFLLVVLTKIIVQVNLLEIQQRKLCVHVSKRIFYDVSRRILINKFIVCCFF